MRGVNSRIRNAGLIAACAALLRPESSSCKSYSAHQALKGVIFREGQSLIIRPEFK